MYNCETIINMILDNSNLMPVKTHSRDTRNKLCIFPKMTRIRKKANISKLTHVEMFNNCITLAEKIMLRSVNMLHFINTFCLFTFSVIYFFDLFSVIYLLLI